MAKNLRMSPEKELLIGLIVSDEFIKQVEPIVHQKYLQASSSKTILTWVLEYYEQYAEAPKQFIQEIYEQHRPLIVEADASIIAKVLKHVSDTYATKDKYNVAYMIDRAIHYIDERKIILLTEEVETALASNNLVKANNLILTYNKISRTTRGETNLWEDKELVAEIFNNEQQEVFSMPGVLGEYMGAFRRGNLYSYAGIAKRGKTRWLAQTANIGAMQDCNVLLIELEMTKPEIGEILLNHFVRLPVRESVHVLPFFDEDTNEILHKETEFKQRVETNFTKWQRKARVRCAPLHVVVRTQASLKQLEDEILALEYYEGFIPDVIIVDYADYVEGEGYDSRDRTNNIWRGLKQWAKRYDCAVITASHLNGEAIRKDGDGANVGEDKRKLNHVAGMFILNQTPEEKQQGIMRIKATATRFGEYTEMDEVVVLYSYGTGRTYIDSRWKKDIPEYQNADQGE